jgi:hypothetical protein
LGFWNNFWGFVKKKLDDYEAEKKQDLKIQQWEDIRHYSPLAIANGKLTSLACDEATVDIVTDSTLAEPLIPLAESLEAKRYEICSMMNGKGGCFVTMATGEDTEPYHRIIAPADVSVYRMVADKMYEVAMVIDRKRVKHIDYLLIRHHILDENGTLYVYYYTTDKSGNEVYLAEWEHYKNDDVMYMNAFNIGVAYFRSPQDSRGLSQWGVPLNFGCEAVEKKIFEDFELIRREFETTQAKVFADPRIMKKAADNTGWNIPEWVFPTEQRAGQSGSSIDIFSPSIRFEQYLAKLKSDKADWEDMVGLDRGFLTEAEHTAGATATEIRTANTKTRSFVKKIQSAMFDGIKATLEADAVFLNIPLDLYTVMVDWFDAFLDEEAQYNRIASAVDRGVLEKEDELRWLYPNMTDEEIAEKLARLETQSQVNTDAALEKILNGG